jgi:hypothetical protein
VNKNNELFDNYGQLNINLIDPEFEKLKVHLNYSEVAIPLESLPTNIEVDTKKRNFYTFQKKSLFFRKCWIK